LKQAHRLQTTNCVIHMEYW